MTFDHSHAATPYLRIDLPRVRANLTRLATYAGEHGIAIRPHTKTHKSLYLAQMQQQTGAIGLTVAKVGEAQVMAATGADLLLAYPAIDPPRRQALALLAQDHSVRCAVDSLYAVDVLADAAAQAQSTIGILVDLDVGLGRTGLQTPQQALALAQAVSRQAHLRLDGLFCYPGQIWDKVDQQAQPLQQIEQKLAATLDLWRSAGLHAPIVSGGSTPTAYQSHHMPSLTEIRPGTYIFNDMNTMRGGFCQLDQCAATVVATVVSNAVPRQVVIDAGSKTLTSDPCTPAPDSGFGHVLEYPDAVIRHLSEEHSQIDVRACPASPKLGEQLTLIPNHICPCINLQQTIWLDHGDGKLQPSAVDARGCLS